MEATEKSLKTFLTVLNLSLTPLEREGNLKTPSQYKPYKPGERLAILTAG
jgi:hypothetical protein